MMAVPRIQLPVGPAAIANERPPESLKRKRSTPLTPPGSPEESNGESLMETAVHVLATAANALTCVARLYQTDTIARTGLAKAVKCVHRVNGAGGKVIICGVGKSGLVGKKTVATMKSLGLSSSFLHAAEALHGDLGDIKPNDAVLFVTFSGQTQELLQLLPHIPDAIPTLALTSHMDASTCRLIELRPNCILLPAPIPESEESSFGVSAPTTSTTVAIAVGDMLAITAADQFHEQQTKSVFRRNHPGGAIGDRTRKDS